MIRNKQEFYISLLEEKYSCRQFRLNRIVGEIPISPREGETLSVDEVMVMAQNGRYIVIEPPEGKDSR